MNVGHAELFGQRFAPELVTNLLAQRDQQVVRIPGLVMLHERQRRLDDFAVPMNPSGRYRYGALDARANSS